MTKITAASAPRSKPEQLQEIPEEFLRATRSRRDDVLTLSINTAPWTGGARNVHVRFPKEFLLDQACISYGSKDALLDALGELPDPKPPVPEEVMDALREFKRSERRLAVLLEEFGLSLEDL